MKKIVFVATLILMFIFITGCRPVRVVVRERPIEPHYVQPLAPGPNYTWHNGDWIRYGNTYVYHKGFWMKAPSNHRNYISGHWQSRRAGWVWVQGHWS
jgi:hypothetical protein